MTTLLTTLLLAGWTAAASPLAPIRGAVAEALDAGEYTYLRVVTQKGDVWTAVPKTGTRAGAKVTVSPSVELRDFDSAALKRKFARVVFGTLDGASAKAPAVKKAEGPQGRTVSEVFAQKKALGGKAVVVRGKVVKYNAEIMGSNWVHLRDGSGTAAAKDDDLTVTMQEKVSVGQEVTLRGTVSLDKDLGAGYFFPVLVEKASLVKP